MAFGISAAGPLWAAQPVNDRKQQAARSSIHTILRVMVAPPKRKFEGAFALPIDYYK